jgi:hypothetical protein
VSDAASKALSAVVGKVDAVFADYGLDTFYDPPLFHVSLLWTLGDHKELIETDLKLAKKVCVAKILTLFGGSETPCASPAPHWPSFFPIILFLFTNLLTRMTGISLHKNNIIAIKVIK